ncbi:hypothetical protein TSUD_342300 [Trifolium subterraneum]|nr:hypothetical protein TSUD_342300 [Trifolium subterraneum]
MADLVGIRVLEARVVVGCCIVHGGLVLSFFGFLWVALFARVITSSRLRCVAFFPVSFVAGCGLFFEFYLRVVVLSSAPFVSTVLVAVLVLLVADASSLVVLVVVGVEMGVVVAAVGFGVVLVAWY